MKGKKLVIAVILALIVCLLLIPTCAFADGDGDTPPAATPDHTETVNPNAGTTEEGTYTTLQEAVNDAGELEGTTEITVEEQPEGEGPLTLTENVTINTGNTIVINLGGNTLNSKGDYTPAVTVNSGTVTLDNGTINGRIYVENDAKVTLGKNLVLNGELRVNYAYDSNTPTDKQPEVNVNCAINDTNTTNMAAICVWGDSSSGATINIGEGARVVSTHNYNRAIFLYGGNQNVLNIDGKCYIEGSVGVEVDAGELNVTSLNGENPEIVGTAGSAVALIYASKSNVIETPNISGGIFSSGKGEKNIDQYGQYYKEDDSKKNFITGGYFYDNQPDTDFIAGDAMVSKVTDGESDVYAVGKNLFGTITKNAGAGDEVTITATPKNETGRYFVEIEGVAAGVIITNGTKKEIAINNLVIDPGKSYVVPAPTPDPDPDPDPKPTPAPVVVPEQTASEPLSAKYFVVEGKNQQWTAGDLEFKLDSKDVVKVIIDGVEVEFTVAEDGTVTIASAVIEALESGTHEIEFVYADGSCKTAFTVE